MSATPSSSRALAADDLFRIVVVSEPQLSPDRRQVAWVQTRADRELDAYRASIWLGNVDGTNVRPLTSGQHRDTTPRWSPDGATIAFVSNRPPAVEPTRPEDEGKHAAREKPPTQVWSIRVDGGEAVQRTSHPGGASLPAWSPDGSHIAFVGSDPAGDGEDPPTSVGPVADERIVRQIHYRADGKGFLEQYTHIWVTDVASGDMRKITHGPVFDTAPAWAPQGSDIAFAGQRSPDTTAGWRRSGIYLVNTGDGQVQALTPEDALFGQPAWSPAGERVAFTGHLSTLSTSQAALWSVAADGTDLKNHTAAEDLLIGDAGTSDMAGGGSDGPVWLDGDTVLALASTHGETQVVAVNIRSDALEFRTSGAHRISGFTAGEGELLVVRSTTSSPFALERWSGDARAAISSANDAWLGEVALQEAQRLDVTAPDGSPVDAWIIPPRGWDPGAGVRHPLIVQIHGGPHSMYGHALFHEMQLMAAKGYAVLFTNPRGSAGYGQEFLSCTRGAWGETDMPDVMAAVDAASALDWVDVDRLGITGGSYGGYLTNWIIGHDARFKAAVTQRCVSNLYSFVGTSDIGTTFGIHEFGGTPWEARELLLRHSPISYVDRMTTPLLILHSEQDLRCPIEQAEQLYAFLTFLGREVAFVRFPEEGHELSRGGKPSRRIARLHHLLGWFDQHL